MFFSASCPGFVYECGVDCSQISAYTSNHSQSGAGGLIVSEAQEASLVDPAGNRERAKVQSFCSVCCFSYYTHVMDGDFISKDAFKFTYNTICGLS